MNGTPSDGVIEEPELDPVGAIVMALVQKFGDRASLVAERQLQAASSEGYEKWQEVVSRLAPG